MIKFKKKPTPPGEILLEEFLIPFGITQKELADHINCDYKVINRIINERSKVTPQMAICFSRAFETTPDFWLNAQKAIDLWNSLKKTRKISSIIKKRKKHLKFINQIK